MSATVHTLAHDRAERLAQADHDAINGAFTELHRWRCSIVTRRADPAEAMAAGYPGEKLLVLTMMDETHGSSGFASLLVRERPGASAVHGPLAMLQAFEVLGHAPALGRAA